MKIKGRISIPIMFLLSVFSVICIYPLLYLIFYSFKTNEEIFFTNPFGFPDVWRVENYVRAIRAFDIPLYFRNSIFITAVSIIGILLFALPFAYATTRMQWRAREGVSTYLTLGLFIPMQVIIIPLSILVKTLNLSNTHFALIVPYVAFNLAFSSMILGASLIALPKEMEESAFMDGASVYRAFISIIVPLTKPAIATTLIFAFLNVWNEYTLASIFISDNSVKTLPVGLSAFVGEHATEWGPMGACLVLASIPTIIMYLIFSEQVEKALTVGGAVKG